MENFGAKKAFRSNFEAAFLELQVESWKRCCVARTREKRRKTRCWAVNNPVYRTHDDTTVFRSVVRANSSHVVGISFLLSIDHARVFPRVATGFTGVAEIFLLVFLLFRILFYTRSS